jgi:hypothetical protein
MEGGVVGHNFERDPPRDHPCQVWFNLVQRFRGEDLNSNGHQLHQYQQNELKQDLSNQLNSLNTRQSTTYDTLGISLDGVTQSLFLCIVIGGPL